MQVTKAGIQYLPFTILIVVGVLLFVFAPGYVIAYYEATYSESAHGNLTTGVNRSGASYPTGDCAHCHDTFDDSICGVNPLMLFELDNPDSQTHNFCFQCHASDGAAQQVTNYTYSRNFGGGTATFTTIYDAFNPITGSSHHLRSIQDYVTGKGGFTEDTNPCVVCHNPHTAQDNYPVTVYETLGGVNTAIRRSAHYQDNSSNLWGDEDYSHSGYDERLYDLSPDYQAPYYVGKTSYEPAGDDTDDGSNLPNFGRFCYDCHVYSNVYSKEQGRYLCAVNYYSSAHLGVSANGGGFGVLRAPYSETSRGVYILSCTDCHEPHGSTNPTLLRETVNGESGLSSGGRGTSTSCRWYYWCSACHDLTSHPVIWPEARCGQYVGCHLSDGLGGGGGNHGYQF